MATHESHPAAEGSTLAITGMTCSGCVSTVKRVLSRVPGVTGAEVDLGSGRARVSGTASPDALLAAVQAAGYGAQLASTDGTTGERNEHGRNRGCC